MTSGAPATGRTADAAGATGVPPRTASIDLNCDLGESFGHWTMGDDAAMLALVTSANVACGFHAGDPVTMLEVLGDAARRGVTVGAHVGYRDLAGFGRRPMDLPAAELTADVLYQLGALDGIARVSGTHIRYVKPHGALYNTVAHDEGQAAAVVAAVARYDSSLAVLGPPGSAVLDLADRVGLPVVTEAFADRAYAPDGSLVSRREPGAVLHDPAVVARRVVSLATTGRVTAADGTELTLDARSVCLHGDTAEAVALARAVRAALDAAGIEVRAFSR